MSASVTPNIWIGCACRYRSNDKRMQAPAENHLPLDGARHAEIVTYLMRHAPNAWRVLLAPTDYLFDRCDICPTPAGKYPHDCGLGLMNEMTQLRAAFMRTTDWTTANTIIRTLIRLDDRAYRMSIGIRMDGRAIYGEAV